MPAVVGKSFDEAKVQLEALGFKVEREEQDDATRPADTVLKQDPVANSKLGQGRARSRSPCPRRLADQPAIVPDVTGQMVSDARRRWRRRASTSRCATGTDEDNATVVTTNPPANTPANQGDTVIIFAQPGQRRRTVATAEGSPSAAPREDRAARHGRSDGRALMERPDRPVLTDDLSRDM